MYRFPESIAKQELELAPYRNRRLRRFTLGRIYRALCVAPIKGFTANKDFFYRIKIVDYDEQGAEPVYIGIRQDVRDMPSGVFLHFFDHYGVEVPDKVIPEPNGGEDVSALGLVLTSIVKQKNVA